MQDDTEVISYSQVSGRGFYALLNVYQNTAQAYM